MAGRPTKYSPQVIDHILSELTKGRLLPDVCEDDGMPTPTSVYLWLDRYPSFADRYARAKEIQMEVFAWKMLKVAQTPVETKRTKRLRMATPAKRTNPDGTPAPAVEKTLVEEVSEDAVDARRLEVDTMKFLLAKLAPKRYGNQIVIEPPATNPSMDALRQQALDFYESQRKAQEQDSGNK